MNREGNLECVLQDTKGCFGSTAEIIARTRRSSQFGQKETVVRRDSELMSAIWTDDFRGNWRHDNPRLYAVKAVNADSLTNL